MKITATAASRSLMDHLPFRKLYRREGWKSFSEQGTDELWEREERVMRIYVNSPGGRRVWKNSSSFSTPFVEYVESQLIDPE